jgi:hypothetical protein
LAIQPTQVRRRSTRARRAAAIVSCACRPPGQPVRDALRSCRAQHTCDSMRL